MAAKVAQTPNGGYAANRYLPKEFGIDPAVSANAPRTTSAFRGRGLTQPGGV